MADAVFERILLKLSGEALLGDQEYGIDPETVDRIAQEIQRIKLHILFQLCESLISRREARSPMEDSQTLTPRQLCENVLLDVLPNAGQVDLEGNINLV